MNNAIGKIILYIAGLFIIFLIVFRLMRKSHSAKGAQNFFSKQKFEPYIFILPSFILLFLMFGFPLVNSFVMSFQEYNLSAPNKIHFSGFENFRKIFDDSDIWLIVRNSFLYVIASVTGQFLLGMSLAFALRNRFFGRGLYQAIVFLPWAFSAFVIGLIYRWSFNGEYGIVNNLIQVFGYSGENIAWLGTPGLSLLVVILAMIWMGIPFFAIMILAALQSIPADVYEAAHMDGCGVFRRFSKITLPYIKPTIIITILLRTIWIFNSFDLIVIITNGGPANHSQTLPSYMYTKAFSGYDFGLASALGVLLILVLVIYSIFFLRASQYNKAGEF